MDLYSMRADAYDLGYEEKYKLLAYVDDGVAYRGEKFTAEQAFLMCVKMMDTASVRKVLDTFSNTMESTNAGDWYIQDNWGKE